VTLLYFLGIISLSLISRAVRYIFSPFRGAKEGVDLLALGVLLQTPSYAARRSTVQLDVMGLGNREFSNAELDFSETKVYSLLLKLNEANKPCFLG